MCIGIPMIVQESDGAVAVCEGRGETRPVSLLLVGEQPVGTLLLVHLDTAHRVLDEEEARHISDALDALDAVLQGETNVDHLFADLVNREPQLPPGLEAEDAPAPSQGLKAAS